MLPFGYFPCTQDVSPEPDVAQLIDEIIEQSVLCEEVGFDGFFLQNTISRKIIIYHHSYCWRL